MKKISKRLMLLAGVFTAFMAVGTVSQVQAQTTTPATTQGQASQLSADQQKTFEAAQDKAKAEMDRFSKMTPAEQNAYMDKTQQQADAQFDRLSKNLTPEQKAALEASRVKAKAEMDRFKKMTPEQRKAYMDNVQQQMGAQVQKLTPEQQKQVEQLQQKLNK